MPPSWGETPAAPSSRTDPIAVTREMKDVFSGFAFALIGPFLREVVLVFEDDHQPGIVPVVRSSHPGHALQSERELPCWAFCDGLRFHVWLIPGAAIVRGNEVISVHREHRNHHGLGLGSRLLHQGAAIGSYGVGQRDVGAAEYAFPVPHK